jgi:hypothetical protein
MRFRRGLKIAAAIYIVWVALTVGELWPLHRVFDVPPEDRITIVFKELINGPRADITPREAHLLWVTRDPEPADGTFDTFTGNFGTMLSRSHPVELPVTIPLDFLTLIFGESFHLIRLMTVIAAVTIWVMAAATIFRGLRQRSRRTLIAGGAVACAAVFCGMALLGPAHVCFSANRPLPIDQAVRGYLAERAPEDSVITIFDDDSRLTHFDATLDLRRGHHIDLSQRAFTAVDIEALIAKLDDGRVWLLYERGDPELESNWSAAAAVLETTGRTVGFFRAPRWGMPSGVGESITIAHIRDNWVIQSYDLPGSQPLRFEGHSYGCRMIFE